MKVDFFEDCILVEDVLVVGDLHMGLEEFVVDRGVLPRVQLKEVLNKLEGVFNKINEKGLKVKQVVLLGDIKHNFGGISDSEWRDVLKLIDYLSGKVKKIVFIKGNHDKVLSPIIEKRGLRVRDYYKIKRKGRRICFLHGDKLFKPCLDCECLFIGHLHSAISLKDKYKKEKFKCFLRGKWKGKVVYVLPSFSGINYGYDLRSLDREGKEFIFVNNKSLKNFDVFVYNSRDSEVHGFGKLNKFLVI